MPLLEKTYKEQSSLSSYCRSGEYQPLKGVKEKHIPQYRRLIYNIVDDNLATAFPLTQNLLEEEEWDTFVNDFFTNHKCQSSQVWKMPEEVYSYYLATPHPLTEKYSFLTELLWFEWLEVEVYMMADIIPPQYTETGNLLDDVIVLNPELKITELTYPLHLKNAKTITEEDKGKYFVSLHRDLNTGKVLFTNLAAPHIELLDHVNQKNNGHSAVKLLSKYASKTDALNAYAAFVKSGLERNLFLGYAT